jgi:hypothetical protein
MDKISNEIFYFGAAIAGLVAALHLVSKHCLWRASAAALLSILVLADAFLWHHFAELRHSLGETDYPGILTACDYIAPLAALFMLGIIENGHIARRNSWVMFLVGAVVYCLAIIAYWQFLKNNAGATPRLRAFSLEIASELNGKAPSVVSAVVSWTYGAFAVASCTLLLVEVVRRRRGLVNVAAEPTAQWRLVCIGEVLALWLYSRHVTLSPASEVTKFSAGIAAVGILVFGARPAAAWLARISRLAWKISRRAGSYAVVQLRTAMVAARRSRGRARPTAPPASSETSAEEGRPPPPAGHASAEL